VSTVFVPRIVYVTDKAVKHKDAPRIAEAFRRAGSTIVRGAPRLPRDLTAAARYARAKTVVVLTERGVPGVEERLKTAVKVAEGGYPVGFVIAPVLAEMRIGDGQSRQGAGYRYRPRSGWVPFSIQGIRTGTEEVGSSR